MSRRNSARHDIGAVITIPEGSASQRKALYRIPEAMVLLSMSRTAIYEQIRAGRLRTVKQGRARRVPDTAIAEYVALLERETVSGAV